MDPLAVWVGMMAKIFASFGLPFLRFYGLQDMGSFISLKPSQKSPTPKGLGFKGLGVWGLGFRGLGFRALGLGVWGLLEVAVLALSLRSIAFSRAKILVCLTPIYIPKSLGRPKCYPTFGKP